MSYLTLTAGLDQIDQDDQDAGSTRSSQVSGPRPIGGSISGRRMTAPPPPRPLGLPEPSTPQSSHGRTRSRSPLRHSFSSDTDGDYFTDARSTARDSFSAQSHGRPGVAKQLASSFLRVGSQFMGSPAGGPQPNLPQTPQSPRSVHSRMTDAEIEAEAMREKERSRLEAERILTQEASERKRAEERILSMLRPTSDVQQHSSGTPKDDISPVFATPKKERDDSGGGGWMSGLVKKLTPTKDPLTPAQQIINDARARDKEHEKDRKKGKGKNGQWPASPEAKNSDPAFLQLGQPALPSALTTPSSSPSSRLAPSNYSPFNNTSAGHGVINGFSTPTPQRTHGPPGGSPVLGASSPGGEREATPLYAMFNSEGTLDVPATLITIARRFEKLEKWAVSHVRALEDRMKDVEKYLIDKEAEDKEREKERDLERAKAPVPTSSSRGGQEDILRKELDRIKEEMGTFRVLLLDLRSEIADVRRNAPASPALNGQMPTSSSTPSLDELAMAAMKPLRSTPTGESAHSSRSLPQPPRNPTSTPTPVSAFANRNSAIMAQVPQGPSTANGTPPKLVSKPSRTRLPYPSGDYTSTSSGFSTTSNPGSPTSPPMMVNSHSTGNQPHDRSGSDSSYVLLERHRSISPPPNRSVSELGIPGMPRTPNNRGSPAGRITSPTSPSPTPRKRYTVALSGREDIPSPNTATRGDGEVQTALFTDTDSPLNGSRTHTPDEGPNVFGAGFAVIGGGHGKEASDSTAVPDREGTQSPDPTIGGTAITLTRLSTSPPPGQRGDSPKPRPRSAYSMASISPSLKSVQSAATTSSSLMNTPRTPSLRARAQSALTTSASTEALNIVKKAPPVADGSPSKPPHKRGQSIGAGLGLNGNSAEERRVTGTGAYRSATLVTPSGQPFVDPLVIRKKSQTSLAGPSVKSPVVGSAPGSRPPVGQLVAFFDNGEK